MADPQEIIDGRYQVENVSSVQGGMSQIYFVRDLAAPDRPRRVMKVCVLDDEDGRNRFRREVRLMQQINSPLVARILNARLTEGEDRPYFIMPYYADGDLTQLFPELTGNYAALESVFSRLLDCLQTLHGLGIMHRDVKPENFLRGEEGIVIADLGLSVDPSSATHLTRPSLIGAGTDDYAPPEFREPGGFANATAASDIFSVGKTMYRLCTHRSALHPLRRDLPLPLWAVLKKCWEPDPDDRYQSVDELREALRRVFDLLVGRTRDPLTRAKELVQEIQVRDSDIDPLIAELTPLIQALPTNDFRVLSEEMNEPFTNYFLAAASPAGVDSLIDAYGKAFLEGVNYSFESVDPMAYVMLAIFNSEATTLEQKTAAFKITMQVAAERNRYRAKDICVGMLLAVTDENLAFLIIPSLRSEEAGFIKQRGDFYAYPSFSIRQALSEG